MKSTLAERLIEAMNGPPKVTGVALAVACKVAPPSVSGWRTGKSKSLEGNNLLAAAKFLGVRPDWLASGTGPKSQRDDSVGDPLISRDNVAVYVKSKHPDLWIQQVSDIMSKLDDGQKAAAVARLREFVHHLDPPRDGQTLPMAVKKE